MNKGKLIIIGANEFQEPLVAKANRLGYETHVFAWEEGAVAKDSASRFYPISITEKEKILKIAEEIKPQGVVSIASDLAVPTVNYLAEHLGLIGNSHYSSKVSTNKYQMRKVFYENKLPSPMFALINNHSDINSIKMEYPLIVKPVDRSGSRGVTKVNKREELDHAIQIALQESFSGQGLIEEFVAGKEYSIEMISYQGEHHFLAITEKFTTGEPHYIETMHLQPAKIKGVLLQKIIKTLKTALNVLDVKYGASHCEFKITGDDDFKIIEIGARMGGDCIGSDLVEISTGNDFVKMVIDTCVGKNPICNLQKRNDKHHALVKFIFDKTDLDILNNIQINHSDKLHRVSRINCNTNVRILDSSTRLGFFILNCNTYEDCLDLVKYNSSS